MALLADIDANDCVAASTRVPCAAHGYSQRSRRPWGMQVLCKIHEIRGSLLVA